MTLVDTPISPLARDALGPVALNMDRLLEALMRSIGLQQAGQLDAALACLEQLPAMERRAMPVRAMAARLLARAQRFEAALAELDACLAQAPESPEMVLLRAETLEQALAYADAWVARAPEDAGCWLLQGNLALVREDFERAVTHFRHALAVTPLHPEALNQCGNALVARERLDEARVCYTRLLATAPEDARAHFNLANVLQREGCLEEALATYATVGRLQPDFAEACLEQAHCHFLRGDFGSAWPLYEARWRTAQLAGLGRYPPESAWRGVPTCAGRTILVWAEQGLGDTIHFLRYVPLLVQRGAHVLLWVPAALRALAASLGPEVVLVGDAATPAFDLHCPLMSLPLALGESAPMPAPLPYLRAAPEAVAAWAQRLGARRRPRLGIAWAGRQYGLRNRSRDLPLAALAPLASLDVDWVCLQKTVPEADRAVWPGLPGMVDVRGELGDFADTAALMASLDGVVSVDTAIAHLAGALGCPGYLLLRRAGEWRWGLSGHATPWYPTLRLFRQTRHGEWAGVVAALAAFLAMRR